MPIAPTHPFDEVNAALYARLTADVTITWPVLDEIPEDQAYPYIVIGDHAMEDDSAKGLPGALVTTTITAISDQRGSAEVNAMLKALLASVVPTKLTLTGGLTVWDQELERVEVLRNFDGEKVLRIGVARIRIKLTT